MLVADKGKRNWLFSKFLQSSFCSDFHVCPLQAQRRFKGFPAYCKYLHYRAWYLCAFFADKTLINSGWQRTQPNAHFFSSSCCYRWTCSDRCNIDGILLLSWQQETQVADICPYPLISIWAWMWWRSFSSNLITMKEWTQELDKK